MKRARKLKAIRNEARGTWVCFPVVNGKRTTRKLGLLKELTQEQADQKAAEILPRLKSQVPPTVEEIVTQYRNEHLSGLRQSTQRAAESWLKCYVIPKWGRTPIRDLKPREVQLWIERLPLAGKTKGHLRGLLHNLYDFSMWSGAVSVERNPLDLVRIRGASKRQHQPQTLMPTEFRSLCRHLAEPFRTMVVIQACLGLRVSELLALRWHNVDWNGLRINVECSMVAQHLAPTKTEGSRKVMSLDASLAATLSLWRRTTEFSAESDWIFASPVKLGRLPLSYTSYRDAVQRASVAAGLGKIGTHSFRHSFRSWLDAMGAKITVQRELMRHRDIRMTLDTYGRLITDAQKEAGSRVVAFALTDSEVIPPPVTH